MDKLVKDMSRPIADVRREILRRKKQPPFSQAVIQLNPKIDQSQRRLQCSISYVRLFKNLAPGRDRKAQPRAEIFGRPIPPAVYDDSTAGKERYQIASERIMAEIAKLQPPPVTVI
jgi:hypothetical protein